MKAIFPEENKKLTQQRDGPYRVVKMNDNSAVGIFYGNVKTSISSC